MVPYHTLTTNIKTIKYIILPKKTSVKDCNESHTTNPLSHSLKIFLRVIYERKYKKIDLILQDQHKTPD